MGVGPAAYSGYMGVGDPDAYSGYIWAGGQAAYSGYMRVGGDSVYTVAGGPTAYNGYIGRQYMWKGCLLWVHVGRGSSCLQSGYMG